MRTNQDKTNLNVKGFNCNDWGHRSVNCKHKKDSLRCYHCKIFGHKAKFCNPKDVNRITLRNSRNNHGKIQKSVKILGKKGYPLNDTSSDVTMVKFDFYVDIGSPALTSDDITNGYKR